MSPHTSLRIISIFHKPRSCNCIKLWRATPYVIIKQLEKVFVGCFAERVYRSAECAISFSRHLCAAHIYISPSIEMDIRVHSTEQKDYLHRDWIAFGWTGGCVNFISDNIINLLTHVDDICVCVCSYVTCMWKTYTNIYTYLCLRRFVLCHIYIVVHTQSSVISILQTKLPPSLALENRAHHNWTSNVICSLLLLCFVRQIRHIIRRVLRTHRAMAALWREHVYSHYVCMCVCVS